MARIAIWVIIRRHMWEEGYDPDEAILDGEVIRKRLGMSQRQFAEAIHVPIATLQNWEQGGTLMDLSARALITILAREPKPRARGQAGSLIRARWARLDIPPRRVLSRSITDAGKQMAQVTVRNLDEQVVAALRRKAELHGHSLEQALRMALTSAARLTSEERVPLTRRIRRLTPANVEQTDSSDLIRRDRNARRRSVQ